VRRVAQVMPKVRGKVGEVELVQKARVEEEVVREACLRRPVHRSWFEIVDAASCCATVHERVAEEESAVVVALVLEAEIAWKMISSRYQLDKW
jgi:hypothetical protein